MIEGHLFFSVSGVIEIFGPKDLAIDLQVCTDTRYYTEGQAFIALEGKNFSAFDFIDDILQQKCPLVVFNNKPENLKKVESLLDDFSNTSFIGVPDTNQYIQNLGNDKIKFWNRNGDKRIIGITGSNGKTTNKEMIYFLLEKMFPNKNWKNWKNFNNHIGVPLTIFGLTDEHDNVVLEMGTNHPGEIKRLASIGLPNSGYITNIGDSHLEFFHNRENVFTEKSELFFRIHQNNGGIFLKNTLDPFLVNLPKGENIFTFGKEGCDFNFSYEKQQSTLKCLVTDGDGDEKKQKEESFVIKNKNLTGEHNFLNMAMALSLLELIFPGSIKENIKFCREFEPTDQRSVWEQRDGANIFFDAYNANPSSVLAALEGFKDSILEKDPNFDGSLIVLGDMNELGSKAKSLHVETGRHLKSMGFKNAIFIGKYAECYQEGLEIPAKLFKNTKEFLDNLQNGWYSSYSNIFIKGSRSLELENLLK